VSVAVLVGALLAGLFTLIFLLDGVRRVYGGRGGVGVRVLVITTLLSVLTGIFTIWQLAQVVQQFAFQW
jgi:hypothetical protein